jgi:DNA repair protein RecO (recombination protein O)
MLFHTNGLVLNAIKYKESSVIVKIFTNKFGLQSYIVNGVRSKKSNGKIALLQSLTLLDMVVYKNEKKDIQRISEFRCLHTYTDLPFDHHKSTIALFITEILSKSLSTEYDQDQVFEFLKDSLIHFDTDKSNNRNNFHLLFLYQLNGLFGFDAPAKEIMNQIETWLPYTLSERDMCLHALEKMDNSCIQTSIELTGVERKLCLHALVVFMQHNIPPLQHLKSLDVIKSVYS